MVNKTQITACMRWLSMTAQNKTGIKKWSSTDGKVSQTPIDTQMLKKLPQVN